MNRHFVLLLLAGAAAAVDVPAYPDGLGTSAWADPLPRTGDTMEFDELTAMYLKVPASGNVLSVTSFDCGAAVTFGEAGETYQMSGSSLRTRTGRAYSGSGICIRPR